MRGVIPLVLVGLVQVFVASSAKAACPLDLVGSNLTMVPSLCSNKGNIRKCCRYINAFVAISVARYANTTGSLGVDSHLSDTCIHSISQTLALYGVPMNVTDLCGFGTKIPVHYECEGQKNVKQMLGSPGFVNVSRNCKVPISAENGCKKCVNEAILFLHKLVGTKDNMTFSTCRDATFVALASQFSSFSTVDLASCYFGVPGITSSETSSRPTPELSHNPANASQLMISMPHIKNLHYHISTVTGIGIALIAIAMLMFVVLIFLIRRKKKQLGDAEPSDEPPAKVTPAPRSVGKFTQDPTSLFRKFSYKETKTATSNFSTVLRQEGSETLYKAQFKDGLVAAVKKLNQISKQTDDEFCREVELLARLHHRHLIGLRGYCIETNNRFLMYEFMAKGSLEDHLHAAERSPLSWQTRIQIAIDVANALEYLHFYHDPPLPHRDIKSSNVLLDENFVAKVANVGLADSLRAGSISCGYANSKIQGTPGLMDPEYNVTQELTEKSDVYSYGVLLLEIITGRIAVHGNTKLVEWAQPFMTSESTKLLDPNVGDSFDFNQLQTIIKIVQWCTQKEGANRPSIKQVLRLLYESCDPLSSGFIEAVVDDAHDGRASKGNIKYIGEARGFGSSSGTTRSFCSRSFLLESSSPQSPHNHLRF